MATDYNPTVIDGFYEQVLRRITSCMPGTHFDLYFGQYDPQVDETGAPIELPFHTPAEFFEIKSMDVTTLGNKRKQVVLTFSLHVVDDVIQEVDSSTKLAVRKLGHKHLQRLDETKAILDGWNGNEVCDGFNQFGPVEWIGGQNYLPNGMMIVHVLDFKVRLTDDSTRRKFTTVTNATEDLSTQLEKQS